VQFSARHTAYQYARNCLKSKPVNRSFTKIVHPITKNADGKHRAATIITA
jgi:hypothetical protein